MTRVLITAFLVASLAGTASAQLTEIQPGARVRLRAPGVVAGRVDATVLSRTSDALVIGGPSSAPLSVPLSSLTSVELSRGKSRSLGAVRGAIIGIPVGLALGVLAYASGESCSPTCGPDEIDFNSAQVFGAMVGGSMIWGAGIGALVGVEKWDRFDLGPRTSFDVRRGRAAIGLAIAF